MFFIGLGIGILICVVLVLAGIWALLEVFWNGF